MACECEIRLAVAAAKDGLFLRPGISHKWVSTHGPFGLTPQAARVEKPILSIAQALGADLEAMRLAKAVSRPKCDLLHLETGTVIEVDELQHFTSHRLITFDHYPADASVGFEIDQYRHLCERYKSKADKAWGTKSTATFGPKSRGQQRAFYDALRDLAIPAAGLPPVIRILVPDRNVERAWKEARERVLTAIEQAGN